MTVRRRYMQGPGGFAVTLERFAVLAVIDFTRLLGAPATAWLRSDRAAVAITLGALWLLKLAWDTRRGAAARWPLLAWTLVPVRGAAVTALAIVLPGAVIDILGSELAPGCT